MSKMSVCPNTKCEHVNTCSLSKPHTYGKAGIYEVDFQEAICREDKGGNNE